MKKLRNMVFYTVLLFCWVKTLLIVGKNKDRIIKRKHEYMRFLCRWVEYYSSGGDISNKMSILNIKSVNIFGCTEVGYLLYKELVRIKIDVKCFIDNNAMETPFFNVDVYRPGEEIPKVDAIIVTPFYDYDDIYSQIKKIESTKVMSIIDLIG